MAFNTLKQAFISAPILTHWVLDVQLVVETDASDYTLAAILSIMTKDNEIYPVAFHSRRSLLWSSTTMSMTKNYLQYSKSSKFGDTI